MHCRSLLSGGSVSRGSRAESLTGGDMTGRAQEMSRQGSGPEARELPRDRVLAGRRRSRQRKQQPPDRHQRVRKPAEAEERTPCKDGRSADPGSRRTGTSGQNGTVTAQEAAGGVLTKVSPLECWGKRLLHRKLLQSHEFLFFLKMYLFT